MVWSRWRPVYTAAKEAWSNRYKGRDQSDKLSVTAAMQVKRYLQLRLTRKKKKPAVVVYHAMLQSNEPSRMQLAGCMCEPSAAGGPANWLWGSSMTFSRLAKLIRPRRGLVR